MRRIAAEYEYLRPLWGAEDVRNAYRAVRRASRVRGSRVPGTAAAGHLAMMRQCLFDVASREQARIAEIRSGA